MGIQEYIRVQTIQKKTRKLVLINTIPMLLALISIPTIASGGEVVLVVSMLVVVFTTMPLSCQIIHLRHITVYGESKELAHALVYWARVLSCWIVLNTLAAILIVSAIFAYSFCFVG